MLTYDEVLNLNYYKKTAYTGWMKPLRFLIKQEKPEEGEPIFHAWIWPGPYIFDLTDNSLKLEKTAPFTEEGKCEIVDWINEQYHLHKDEWSSKLI